MADFSLLAGITQESRAERGLEYQVGSRVDVEGYQSPGTVRYYGPHLVKTNKIVYGVELDDPIGKNNGTVGGKKYFTCKKKHGVLVTRSKVKPPGSIKWPEADGFTSDQGFGGFQDDEAFDAFANSIDNQGSYMDLAPEGVR